MPIITDPKTWPKDNQAIRRSKGPLMRVRHPDGHYTKMYEADAIAQGLIQKKLAPMPGNKIAPMPENKSAAAESVTAEDEAPTQPVADDFTTIQGIGPATARLLNAHGIVTFDQLRKAESLDFLTRRVQSVVQEWKNG